MKFMARVINDYYARSSDGFSPKPGNYNFSNGREKNTGKKPWAQLYKITKDWTVGWKRRRDIGI